MIISHLKRGEFALITHHENGDLAACPGGGGYCGATTVDGMGHVVDVGLSIAPVACGCWLEGANS